MPDFSDVMIITDLDGTLLPENKILSEKDLEAIKRFRSDGGKFTIATGRTIQSADRYIKELEIDIPVILYNGSLIYDVQKQEVLFTDELPEFAPDIAKELFGFMKNPGGEVLKLICHLKMFRQGAGLRFFLQLNPLLLRILKSISLQGISMWILCVHMIRL